MVSHMNDPRSAPFAATRLTEIAKAQDLNPDDPTHTDGLFFLIRRHFDIRSFGVNAITGNAGGEMVEPHHERDDESNLTDGHEELFAVMSGHAVFTVDGEELDAPAGTLVFVRDPAVIRSAVATADDTTILAIGGRPGAPFEVSRWERTLYPVTDPVTPDEG
jgi:mannose-6-phosphate isomerase-like protein (cupin superfamily)